MTDRPRPLHHPSGGPPPRSGEDLGRVRHRTLGADERTVNLARKLRREMTLPEGLLWRELRGKRAGLKFRRQFPVLDYVADFACVELRLLIEVDGLAHDLTDRPERDGRRDGILNERGWKIVRIAASEVLKDAGAVAQSIAAFADRLRPLHHPADGPPPSPPSRGQAGEDRL
ncbi:MAG: endonuclease domain-containing protein [Sphingopyxis sp.]